MLCSPLARLAVFSFCIYFSIRVVVFRFSPWLLEYRLVISVLSLYVYQQFQLCVALFRDDSVFFSFFNACSVHSCFVSLFLVLSLPCYLGPFFLVLSPHPPLVHGVSLLVVAILSRLVSFCDCVSGSVSSFLVLSQLLYRSFSCCFGASSSFSRLLRSCLFVFVVS